MVTVVPIQHQATWEEAIRFFPEANFLHSWNWGAFHERLGKTVVRLGVYQGKKIVGLALGIVEVAKRARYLTVPGGPLLKWEDSRMVAMCLSSLKKAASDNHCSFIRIRPQILETPANRAMVSSLGFRSSPMHLHAELTHQLDLKLDEEELLRRMRKTTRYGIRRAQKLGIRVTVSQNPDDIKAFYTLQLETAKAHKFVPFGYQFLYEQFKMFAGDNQAVLYTARHKEKILTQAIIIFYLHEADYHYAASSEFGRELPGAYLLQWEAIKEAKHRGLERYNLWGVAPEGERHHRFHGVSVFKRGFRGEDVAYLHASDLVLKPFPYLVNWVVETARRIFRRV